ncbi:hypothetical protein NSQ62_07675 [Solibacillus sp. FSL H8-0523]|uniref:hypothetical protein n=1 Tax=Solibacillus sp. FSL H8-0523 TaxID=2954511 RepID=UPI0031011691
MATFDHKIEVVNGNSTDTFHPETNSGQVYDYNNSAWLNSLIGTLSNLSTTQKGTLVAAINEIVGTKADITALTTHSTSIATTSSLGHVIPDGTTIVIDSNGIISSVNPGTTPPTPPLPITNFRATSEINKIILSWTNPVDASLSGIRIQRKIGGYPTSFSDGATVFNGIATTYTDTDVMAGEAYYYRAFTYSSSNTFNSSDAQQTSVTSVAHPIYTVIIDTTNSNPETSVTYADDAVGMAAGSSAWDNVFPFSEIKPVMLLNGEVNYYLNPNNFAQKLDESSADITSGNDGDVMIQFPKFYTYIRKVGSNVYISLSTSRVNTNYKCYAHTKQGGTEKDYCYIGAYNNSIFENRLRSLSNTNLAGAMGYPDLVERTEANGAGYQLYSFYQHVMIQILYLIKYKNLDSQDTIALGAQELDILAGTLNNLGMTFINNIDMRVKLFGIEHLWGAGYTVLGGIQIDVNFNIFNAYDDFNIRQNYTNVGAIPRFEYGSLKSVQGTNELGFLPSETGGTGTTYFTDVVEILNDSVEGYAPVVLDGGFEPQYSGGIFSAFANVVEAGGHISSRLAYL